MAVLLAWISWSGTPDDAAWRRLREAAAGRVRFPGREAWLPHGRLFWAPQRSGEPDGLLATLDVHGRGNGVWAIDGDGLGEDVATGTISSVELGGGPHASVWMASAQPRLVLRRDVLGRRLLAYARVPGGLGRGLWRGNRCGSSRSLR